MTPKEESIEKAVEERLVKHMVDRFLGWRLPKSFHPDGGISFKDDFNEHTDHPMKHEPTGTNLFTAEQAKEMFRFLLEHEDGTPFLTTLHSTGYTEGVKAERERVRKFVEEKGNETMPVDPVSVKNFYTALKKFITTNDETV